MEMNQNFTLHPFQNGVNPLGPSPDMKKTVVPSYNVANCKLIRLSLIPSTDDNEDNTLEHSPNLEKTLGSSDNVEKALELSPNVVKTLGPSPNIENTVEQSPNVENTLRASQNVENTLRPSQNVENTLRPSQNVDNTLRPSPNILKTLGLSPIVENRFRPSPNVGSTSEPRKQHTYKGFCKITHYNRLLGESRVMLRWKSSVWKLLWKELLVYTIVYFSISTFYRFSLNVGQQLEMERVIRWLGNMYTGLPLTFILGFYVSLVVNRWWQQYCKLPWPDTIAISLRSYLPGPEEQHRMIRRTVIRYCLLSYVLCVRRMSARLRKRFPSMQEVMRTGLLRPDEYARIGEEEHQEMYESNWWLPIKWCTEIVSDSQKKGLVVSPPAFNGLTGQIAAFRHALTEVATYGHIPIPLVYTQVVTLAVYIYFGVALVGEQWIIYREPGDDIDLWYPIFTSFKFLFYFGWLRVADTLYNPFGEDDEDFDLNGLLDRHLRVAMSIVDQVENPPKLRKDIFWGQTNPELVDFPRWQEMYMAHFYGEYVVNEDKDVDKHEDFLSNVEKRDPML